jgi:uncharacterized SAM-binding protein YcdF (DUF218 family)
MPEDIETQQSLPISAECAGSEAYCLAIRTLLALKPMPQAIFVLGGDRERETFAVELARENTELHLWISSGQSDADRLLSIPWLQGRVHIDWKALDTVTNFSTMISQFHQVGVSSLYLVTSDYHMRRANAVASIMLGLSGIKYMPIVVPPVQARPPEQLYKVMRDVVRAFIWVISGVDFRFAVEWMLPGRAKVSKSLRGRQQLLPSERL